MESKQKLVLVGSATQTEGESNSVELTDEVKVLLHGPNGGFTNDGAEDLRNRRSNLNSLFPSAAVDAKSGPISCWSQSFVLV